jgi:hypothetical protein
VILTFAGGDRMSFFKPEDFAEQEWQPLPASHAANIANQKLNQEAKVVYTDNQERWDIQKEAYSIDTHCALLICIEEIKKAECEHSVVVIELGDANGANRHKCGMCEKTLVPTGWQVIE